MSFKRIAITVIATAVALILSAQSCHPRHPAPEPDDQAEVEPEPVIERLPDTTYASAGALEYVIKVADSTINGQLQYLDDPYAESPGIFTFRGGQKRDFPQTGHIKGKPCDLSVEWTFLTGVDNRKTNMGTWGGGTGWTGQPMYVEWPEEVRRHFDEVSPGLKGQTPKREIMVASLCSKVFFIDYETGKASREPIYVTNPTKGTMSLDPDFNGNLYLGQAVQAEEPFGALTMDLFKHEVTHIVGKDRDVWRNWHAYDSSPIVAGGFLFRPGENGKIYKYARDTGTLNLVAAIKYKANAGGPGIESSMAVYRNYGYTGDNHGNIICFNLDNLKPVWRYKNLDDTDATIVVAEENGIPFLYTGCEVDKQGANGDCHFVKLNGLDGSLVWEQSFACHKRHSGEKTFDGGLYSTPLLGRGDCDSLIFASVTRNSDGANGDFVAMNRYSGEIRYKFRQRYYAWSSPVPFLDDDGKMYVLLGDCSGYMYIIDGISGEVLVHKSIGANFESSPVVVDDCVVVGSRGDTIYKVKIECENATDDQITEPAAS